MTTQIARILIGVTLLLLGRELYWLYVAGVGFVVAMDLMTRVVQIEPTILIFLIALIAGLIGALLAVLLQRAAIGVGGFLAGGYVLLVFSDFVGMQTGMVPWILAVIGGAIGLVLTLMLFEWALIILSSVVGAGMVAQSVDASQSVTVVLFLAASAVGIVVQATLMDRGIGGRQRPPERRF